MKWISSATANLDKSIELVVWPTKLPQEDGTLFNLDLVVDSTSQITLVGQDFLTIRVAEQATTTGYAWEDLLVYPCLEL